VTPTWTVIENFEDNTNWFVVGAFTPTAYLSSSAAHDGPYGLDDYDGTDWIYRNDAAAQVRQGEKLSVWLKFANVADGRAYFGFGASAFGTLSLVAAPNTGQLMIQDNSGYTNFTIVGAVSQTYLANHWYRLEVNWGAGGVITGRLFDSNGTTLLNSVTATDNSVTSGGIAFRARGNDKYYDTVTVSQGATPSAMPHVVAALATPRLATASSVSSGTAQPAPTGTHSAGAVVHPSLSLHALDSFYAAHRKKAGDPFGDLVG
jgi:hypothetical protein